MFIKQVSSPILTVFYCFIGLCFVEWVSVFNCKLINNETDLNAWSVKQWQLKVENFFYLLLPRFDPRTSSLTAQCIIHCSNLSFCLLLLICLYLPSFMFSKIRFVLRQPYCLIIIIVLAQSMFLVIFCCFSVFFLLICCWSYFSFIEQVCSPIITVF